MARKAMVQKQKRQAKFSTREYSRCELCGRPHAVMRKFKICRICFRNLASEGKLPGIKKSSW